MDKIDVLIKVPLFSQLPESALQEVVASLQSRRLKGGEILFNMGDAGDELVIVEQGEVAIYVPQPGAPGSGQPIRIFQPGELFGEMALIDRKPRSLSARAETDSLVLTLNGDAFRSLVGRNPDVAMAVMSGLSDRIRYTTDFLAEVRLWVRRIAEGDYQSKGLVSGEGHLDQTLASLAAEFVQMAARVQEREEILRREVAQLRIEIDEAKRKQDVARITGSDYYKNLKERAAALRKRAE